MAKTIILSVDDVPTKLELVHTISRLRKCCDLLTRNRGKRDMEDPESLNAVANFLEMIVRRESKGLKKTTTIKKENIIASENTDYELTNEEWDTIRNGSTEPTETVKALFDRLRGFI